MNEVAGQNAFAGGMIVVAGTPGSPGSARGIAIGDIKVAIGGKPLLSAQHFSDAVNPDAAAETMLIT